MDAIPYAMFYNENMPTELNPKETTRAAAYELWLQAPK
jgi:hypothetical protein